MSNWNLNRRSIWVVWALVTLLSLILMGWAVSSQDAQPSWMARWVPVFLADLGGGLFSGAVFWLILDRLTRASSEAKFDALPGVVESSVRSALGHAIPGHFPTKEFGPSEYPDPRLNRFLEEDIDLAEEYWFRGASARSLAARFLSWRPSRELTIHVILPDPLENSAIAAQTNFYMRSRAKERDANGTLRALAAGVYGLYILAANRSILNVREVVISLTKAPVSRRVELCQGVAAWVCFPAFDDHRKYPRTARFDAPADLYQLHTQELHETESLALDTHRKIQVLDHASWQSLEREVFGGLSFDQAALAADLVQVAKLSYGRECIVSPFSNCMQVS